MLVIGTMEKDGNYSSASFSLICFGNVEVLAAQVFDTEKFFFGKKL